VHHLQDILAVLFGIFLGQLLGDELLPLLLLHGPRRASRTKGIK
jgi:hypothetical protein